MVNVSIANISKNQYSISIIGHADYNPGNDIVCSAISAISYTILGSLMNIPTAIVKYDISSGDMVIDVEDVLMVKDIVKVSTIIDVAILGFMQIEAKYPSNIKVNYDGREKVQ